MRSFPRTVAVLAALSEPLAIATAQTLVESAVTSSDHATLAGAAIKAADLFDTLSGGVSWTK